MRLGVPDVDGEQHGAIIIHTVLTLYRAPWSTNVERVTLALAHKRLEADAVIIDYADRSPVEAVSGQPLVPVLADSGAGIVVADSLAILRHLERVAPEPALFPADPREAAVTDLFLEWFDRVWKVAPNAIEAGDGDRLSHAAAITRHLDLFERLLAGRDHLLGDAFGAADCAAFPFLKYAGGRDPADDEAFHRILDDYQDTGGRPRLAAWIERVRTRPGTAAG